jgi:hypothetical protein
MVRTRGDKILYHALSIVGPRNKIDKMVRKLPLLPRVQNRLDPARRFAGVVFVRLVNKHEEASYGGSQNCSR